MDADETLTQVGVNTHVTVELIAAGGGEERMEFDLVRPGRGHRRRFRERHIAAGAGHPRQAWARRCPTPWATSRPCASCA
ncbi:MAG: hypothetical protein R2851_27130 [Caldilineaceae bacterium]